MQWVKGAEWKKTTVQYNGSHFETPPRCSVPSACTSLRHNTITELWCLKRHCRRVEVLEEKIAAAHSGWSEIPFCLIQDGFHCEISEDQYRIKMEKPEGRREKRERCSVWSGQLGSRCLDFCCCCYTEINSIQSECCFCVTDLSRVLYCIRKCTMWVAFIEFKMIGLMNPDM